jgi:DNA-binding CsgD family transcriptional regulator
MLGAYHIAAVASRDELDAQLPYAAGPDRALLKAVIAQYDGNVEGAIRVLRGQLRAAGGLDGGERASIADVLAPILVSRGEMAGLATLCDDLERAGWRASAYAFRALLAASAGQRETAARAMAAAQAVLKDEPDDVIRFRVLQRLALAAFYLDRHTDAVDLALASAHLSVSFNAWRAAAAGYSIAYNVHHDVTADWEEADRFARLWHDAATRSGDKSFEHSALVAEYELAVQFCETGRIAALERKIQDCLLPQQYLEGYAFALSYALVRGATDLTAMRTLLQVLQSTRDRSRAESALCSALISVAHAAEFADEEARRNVHEAISRLGRGQRWDPAYERYYRRLTRACVAAACILIGDDVRADRTVAVREARTSDEMGRLPALIRQARWSAFPRPLRGIARVFATAAEKRRSEAIPASLTPAEFEVLRLLSSGWSAGKIARATDRSVNTVYKHTRSILAKLEASRASEAVAIARERGFLM